MTYTSCLHYGNRSKGHRTSGHTTPGAYAGYVVNHIDTVHRIPDTVCFDEASLVTNLGCVLYGCHNLGGYVVGETVLGIGAGPLGLASAAAGRALAAERVFLSNVLPERLAVGVRVGADRVIDASKEDPLAVILEETAGRGVDYTIESSGTQAALDLAVRATRRNGKVLLAIPHDPVPVDFKDLSLNDKDIIANRGESRANVSPAVSLLATGRVSLLPLVTHTFPLRRFEQALRTFRERLDGGEGAAEAAAAARIFTRAWTSSSQSERPGVGRHGRCVGLGARGYWVGGVARLARVAGEPTGTAEGADRAALVQSSAHHGCPASP